MDFARNEGGFCVGFAWNLILFSFMREREGYKHHVDCTVSQVSGERLQDHWSSGLIFAPKHRLWVLIRTASLRRF